MYQEDMLQGVVKHLNMTLFSGQEWVILPKRSRQLRSGCRGTFWPSSAPRIGFQGVQTSKPWTINVACFGGHGMPKVSQQPREPEEIPCEGSSRDPFEDGVCCKSRVTRVSQGLRRGIGQPFCVTLL